MTNFRGNCAYDPKTGKSETIVNSYNGKPLNGLNDLVFDESGGLYFTEPWIECHTSSGRSSTYQQIVRSQLFAENIAYPNGVAISADGQRVYISEFDKISSLCPFKEAKESP